VVTGSSVGVCNLKNRVFALFTFLVSASIYASVESKVTLDLYTESFPPYNFMHNNELTGINAEVIQQACDMVGIECVFHLMPWQRALSSAQINHNAGLFTTSRTSQREAMFDWVGPLVSGNACFYKLKNRTDIIIEDVSALRNYTVGIARGDIYESILVRMGLEKGKQYLTYSKKHDDSKMFKLGRLDLLIGSSITLNSQLSAVELTPEDVEPVFAIQDTSLKGNYLAFNKRVSTSVQQDLQRAIDTLKDNGTFDHIISKYLPHLPADNDLRGPNLQRCVDGATHY